jgi:hypothetical protein
MRGWVFFKPHLDQYSRGDRLWAVVRWRRIICPRQPHSRHITKSLPKDRLMATAGFGAGVSAGVPNPARDRRTVTMRFGSSPGAVRDVAPDDFHDQRGIYRLCFRHLHPPARSASRRSSAFQGTDGGRSGRVWRNKNEQGRSSPAARTVRSAPCLRR